MFETIFDHTHRRARFSWAAKPLLLALGTTSSFVFGACFTGYQAYGLPCTSNIQCGTDVCKEGFCGGVVSCDDESQIDAELACDGTPDCPNGYDEDPAICPDATLFDCLGGDESIPFALVCDGTPDCTDGSDEGSICAGMGINQCGQTDGDVSYTAGPTASGAGTPLKVIALDMMGTSSPDALFASRDGNMVTLAFDLDSSPKQFSFDGMSMFGGRKVKAVEVGDVNGDKHDDVVIAVAETGLGGAVYVYKNNSTSMDPMMQQPSLFGGITTLPDLGGGGVEPTVRAVRLGRLNDDSSIDMVGVFDIGPLKGMIGVSFGDSAAAAGGGNYFDIQGLPIGSALNYEEVFDAALTDLNGDGLDDLLVSGVSGMPTLWIVSRTSGTDVTGWATPITMETTGAGLLAVGKLQMAPPVGADIPGMPDVAILDLMTSRIVLLRYEMGMGMMGLNAFGDIQLGSGSAKSLKWVDINCDGNGDFVYSVGSPARVEVLFGNGMGGVIGDAPLVIEGTGIPGGDLDVAQFDGDQTPDIFTMVEAGNGLAMPEAHVFVTAATQQ